ncbi:zinc finger (C3HC4-type RING finger) family protein [Actinidia rufa]|uniref:Zinc finger (C3HC4-type RING finger) family protein n=1 Tax=Actinidia rufa TaxID=165716 RepID=A0A7J0H4H7_9ERIC|nr:zinc finger (C3HC4-type RING finger) family protein [Actinidia rufa]
MLYLTNSGYWRIKTKRGKYNNLNWSGDSSCEKVFKLQCISCMKQQDIKFALKLAGEAIVSQHVEVKLLQGMLPKCPYDGCKTELKIENCKVFLTSELCDIMSHRIKESSIPASDKIYCPYSRCSALMSKAEVLVNARSGGSSKCKRCHGLFCVNCKVPWHNNMSCNAYKSSNPYPCAEDAKLKSLATKNLWRQCVKCNHMVELAAGCNHIYCSSPPSLASYACVIFADVVMSFATFAELSGRARKLHVPVLFGMSAISCMKSVIGFNSDEDD